MTEKLLPTAAGPTGAFSAGANLDLSCWPQWMREALAPQPDVEVPAKTSETKQTTSVDPASIRILTRMPSRSS